MSVGLNLPTGSDVSGALPAAVTPLTFEIENEAVHLQPFIGVTASPSSNFFFHAFAQIDAPVSDYRAAAVDDLGTVDTGVVRDQALAMIDIGAGCWLLRDQGSSCFTGLAAITEFHYTTALQDPDSLSLLDGTLTLGNLAGRFDVSNLTAGLHAEISRLSSLRVAGVFPLDDGADRFFDSEIQVAFIRRF